MSGAQEDDVYRVEPCEECEGKFNITYSEEAQWMTNPQKKDIKFVSQLSFIPISRHVDFLRTLSNNAIKKKEDGKKYVESKLGSQWDAFCEMAPWNRFGKGVVPAGNVADLRIANYFAFVRDGGPQDLKFPMSVGPNGPSMGLNGVLIKFDEKYGAERFNLFQGSEDDVNTMLQDFITFRDANENDILKAIVDHMNDGVKHNDGVGQDEGEENDYVRMRDFLNTIHKHLPGNKLCDIGLALTSFCQSWDVKTLDTTSEPTANFSVPSPHFQTRVIVKDGVALCKFLMNNMPGDKEDTFREIETWFKAYSRSIKELTKSFVDADPTYSGKFINLDGYLDGYLNRTIVRRLFAGVLSPKFN